MLINMNSKLSRNSSSGVSGSLGLQIRHNKIMAKEALTHRMKDKARRFNLKKISPRNRLIKVIGSLGNTLESGVSSTKSIGTTLMNIA
jgi:hypothetical protein